MTTTHLEKKMDEILPASICDADRDATIRDLMFLAAWEKRSVPWPGSIIRIRQIRRANPELASAVHADLTGARG